MTKAKPTEPPLADRIAHIFEGLPSSADVGAVIAAAEEEVQRLERECETARRVSLDPRARAELVAKARQDIADLEFGVERLSAALSELRLTLRDAKAREEEAKWNALRAEVERERDELADALRERYPALAGELADLLASIKANNDRVASVGLQTVETLVRGIPAHGRIGLTPCAYLIDTVRLPHLAPLEAAYGRALWPLPIVHSVAVPQRLAEVSAARGAEMQRVGEQVEANKRAEANAPRRRPG